MTLHGEPNTDDPSCGPRRVGWIGARRMSAPTHGALFAGVGGDTLGFDAAGWETRWLVEKDERCRSVLRRHWPDAEVYGDVADVSGTELEPVDVITYGFPCQDLSVAGKRAGLDGERSGLFFEAIRIIREMRAATDGRFPRVAVAENVPGLFSVDDGAAFGRCLDALADVGALAIEWAVLDAQHFGVPQRRRRVFIVACFDPRAASRESLLPVAARCQRHPGPCGTEGPAFAGTVGTCAYGVSENQRAELRLTDYSRQLTAGGGKPGQGYPTVLIARDDERPRQRTGRRGNVDSRMTHDNGSESRATVLAFHATQDPISSDEATPTLGVSSTLGVRRLTPRECERLQGWPDDHTRWDEFGNELRDSFRYRACGNGVAAPCAEWIGRQLLESLAGGSEHERCSPPPSKPDGALSGLNLWGTTALWPRRVWLKRFWSSGD